MMYFVFYFLCFLLPYLFSSPFLFIFFNSWSSKKFQLQAWFEKFYSKSVCAAGFCVTWKKKEQGAATTILGLIGLFCIIITTLHFDRALSKQ